MIPARLPVVLPGRGRLCVKLQHAHVASSTAADAVYKQCRAVQVHVQGLGPNDLGEEVVKHHSLAMLPPLPQE
jgi:hypothetical protein